MAAFEADGLVDGFVAEGEVALESEVFVEGAKGEAFGMEGIEDWFDFVIRKRCGVEERDFFQEVFANILEVDVGEGAVIEGQMIDGLAIMVVCEKGFLGFLDLGFEGIFGAEDEVIVDDEALVGEFLLELFGAFEAAEFGEDVSL